MPRAIRLTEREESDLLQEFELRWQTVKAEWSPWVSNLPRWTRAYRGILPPKNDPWPGCSNFHVPLTSIGVERTHSTMMGLVQRPRDLIQISPTEFSDIQNAKGVQEWINWAFFRQMRVIPQLDRISHRTLMFGRQGVVVVWRRRRKKVREWYTIPLEDIGGEKSIEAAARFYFEDAAAEITKLDFETAKVIHIDEIGVRRDATVRMLREEDRTDPADDELEIEVEKWDILQNCPVLETPLPEDFLMTADGMTPEEASEKYWTRWVTIQELQDKVASREWKLEDTQLRELGKAFEDQQMANEEFLAVAPKTYDESNASVQVNSAIRRGRFCVQTIFGQWDVDHDGHVDDITLTILWHPDGKPRLLDAKYLGVWSATKEAPVAFNDFIYLDTVPMAMGVPEYLRHLQIELNTLHNQRVDSDTIRNIPWFLYDSGSHLVPQIHRVRPGDGIPVRNPASVRFADFRSSSRSDGITQEQIMATGEKMVPMGDVVSGRNPGGRITATGTMALLEQSQAVWDKHIKRFGMFLERCAEISLELYGHNMPASQEFRVTGKSPVTTIKRQAVRQGWDFTVHASMLVSNAESRRTWATMRYEALHQHPLLQSKARQYALIEDLLDTQEVLDPERILGPRPEETTHPSLDPSRELVLFAQGIPWEPHPDEDFEGHLAQHQRDMTSPQIRGNEEARSLLMQHMEHTEALMGLVQRAKMQQVLGMQQGQGGLSMGDGAGGVPQANGAQQTVNQGIGAQTGGQLGGSNGAGNPIMSGM